MAAGRAIGEMTTIKASVHYKFQSVYASRYNGNDSIATFQPSQSCPLAPAESKKEEEVLEIQLLTATI